MTRRQRFLRAVVPMLLGAGVWWFLSWFLSPRPLWTRTFNKASFEVQQEQFEVTEEPVIEELITRLPNHLEFAIQDDKLRIKLELFPSMYETILMTNGSTIEQGKVMVPTDRRLLTDHGASTCREQQSDQYAIRFDTSSRLSYFPQPLHRYLSRLDSLADWLLTEWYITKVFEKATGRVLISHKTKSLPIDRVLTDRWLVLVYGDLVYGDIDNIGWTYHVEAYALPIRSWSSAWAPLIGCLSMVFSWWALRRKRWSFSAVNSTPA